MPRHAFRFALISTLLALMSAASLRAQGIGRGDWNATRAELSTVLEELQRYAASPVYGDRARLEAQRRASALRERLDEGDFREGDLVILSLSGAVNRMDTLTVLTGPRLTLAPYGELALRGVLRTELEPQLSSLVRRSVLDAEVHVRPLVRLAVFGSVGTPGYLNVPLETRLDELIMRAGGPSIDADPAGVRIMRGEATFLGGSEVLDAIASGRTIGTLGLQEGDYLMLQPRPPEWDRSSTLQVVGLVATPLLTFFLLRR